MLQAIVGGALVLSPVLFSGVIFAIFFRRCKRAEEAIAYNTAGAILGAWRNRPRWWSGSTTCCLSPESSMPVRGSFKDAGEWHNEEDSIRAPACTSLETYSYLGAAHRVNLRFHRMPRPPLSLAATAGLAHTSACPIAELRLPRAASRPDSSAS